MRITWRTTTFRHSSFVTRHYFAQRSCCFLFQKTTVKYVDASGVKSDFGYLTHIIRLCYANIADIQRRIVMACDKNKRQEAEHEEVVRMAEALP